MIPIDFPHLVAPEPGRPSSANATSTWSQCADKILCNSGQTRDRLQHFLAGFDRRPVPRHPGAGQRTASRCRPATGPPALPPLQPGRFVLFVSTIEIRKNHRLAYQLWSRLNEAEPALMPLVCVGGVGWRTDDLTRLIAADHDLRGKLILLGGPRRRGSRLALSPIAPSRCIPPSSKAGACRVAESLAYGKYCVASTAPSVAELSRGRARPSRSARLRPPGIARFRRLLTDPGYLRTKERHIAGYRPRSWAEAGEQFVAETAGFR